MYNFAYNTVQDFWLMQNYSCPALYDNLHTESYVAPTTISQSPKESRKKEFTCESCRKVFKTENNLKNHRKTVHDRVFRVTCQKCGQVFSNKYILRKHVLKQHPPKADIN